MGVNTMYGIIQIGPKGIVQLGPKTGLTPDWDYIDSPRSFNFFKK